MRDSAVWRSVWIVTSPVVIFARSSEVIFDFPGYGLWVWQNNTAWSSLRPFDADDLVVGNLDGSAGEDILIDFPGMAPGCTGATARGASCTR